MGVLSALVLIARAASGLEETRAPGRPPPGDAEPIVLPPVEVRAAHPLIPPRYRATPAPSYPFALLHVLAVVPTAGADDAEEAVRAATRVVMTQLEAFRRGDFTAAYGFASAMIQQIFDRERFEAMVRGGYPEIARSVVAFVSRAELAQNDTVYLTLRIQGANGNTVEATYELVREAGNWRINGVVTRAAPGMVSDPRSAGEAVATGHASSSPSAPSMRALPVVAKGDQPRQ